jgi:Sec-independent protein secretion pathway component TatC
MYIGAVTVWMGVCLLLFEYPVIGVGVALIGYVAWQDYKKKHTLTDKARAA